MLFLAIYVNYTSQLLKCDLFSLFDRCYLMNKLDIQSIWKRQSSGSGHAFLISSGRNRISEKSEFRPELPGRNRVPVHHY